MSPSEALAPEVASSATALARLYPGYFAAVMATGIVSIDARWAGHPLLSNLLLAVAIGLYFLLVAAYLARAAVYGPRVERDLTQASTTFLFLTFVAGTSLLGVRLAEAGAATGAAVAWAVAAVAWVCLLYVGVLALVLSEDPPVESHANGAWMLPTVGSASLAILSATLSVTQSRHAAGFLLLSFSTWAIGVGFYGFFLGLLLVRLVFHPVRPHHLTGPYWIVMGSAAITTVAGLTFARLGGSEPGLAPAVPFVVATSLILWAWQTWWIPLLALLAGWKYLIRRAPLRYRPSFWSVVFPLGMYAEATWLVARALGSSYLLDLARTFFWVALAAWLVVGLGFFVDWARHAATEGPALAEPELS